MVHNKVKMSLEIQHIDEALHGSLKVAWEGACVSVGRPSVYRWRRVES